MLTRYARRRCCIASSGCNADQTTLHKFLKFRMSMYEHQVGAQPYALITNPTP
jgi:hypothetical protein